MTIDTPEKRDQALQYLYELRDSLQDIREEVDATYPPGSPQRAAYAAARLAVDKAINDLKNQALGSLANQMAAALPDIKRATSELKDKVDGFEQIAGAADKVAKVLTVIAKIVALVA